ncbi:clavesin-2-like [Cotesia typhae]|uniref:clavesin-2-like n=1 Tax=Cotesia typhae TaxID=2053667 RepID=UPI003D6871BA
MRISLSRALNSRIVMAFQLEVGPLDEETKKLAEVELRETPENVKNGIATLRKLLEESKTLYYRTDDEFLLIFLRPCKFYPESAYALMQRIADFKVKNAALLDNLMPDDEKTAIFENNVVNVLKDRDHKRRRVLIVNAGKSWDPSKVTADQMFRIFYLIHEAAMLEPESQVRGVVVIMDFDGLSMKQVMGLSPSFSMRLLSFIQDALPLRLKEVHFVKQPFLFNIVWNMFKPFTREKLRKRMFFHGSKMNSLHAYLAPSHLPMDYGGELPEINYTAADWFPTILSCNDSIRAWNTYGYIIIFSKMDLIKLKTLGRYEATLDKVIKSEPLKVGKVVFQLDPHPLDRKMIEKARTELNETAEVVTKALEEIRDLLKGEPELYVPDDDYFFAKFLRPCKWSAKPAFELMKRFYRYRVTHSRYCDNLTPIVDRQIFISGVITPLPSRTDDGCRLVLIEGGSKWKPKEVTLDQIFRGVMLLLDAAIVEPATQVSGVHVILDMAGLSLTHVTYFTPSFASAVLEWVQKCLPVRLKGVHIVNQPFIFNMVFAVFKPFLMEKLRKRIHFHGTDKASLTKIIDRKALPTRYGGDLELPAEPIGHAFWEYFCNFKEEFEEADKLGYRKKK